MYVLLVFLALGSVSTHDIIVGSSTGGKKVFDEHLQAGPAVWKQAQNVTINTTDEEVISRIVVTDLRAEKDGDAKIVDGGEGQKKVTIELKSPTVLRGYDFKVEVYAEPNKEFQANPLNKNGPVHPSDFKTVAGDFITPGSKVTPTNLDITTKLPEIPRSQFPPSQTDFKTPRQTRDTEVKKPEENKPKINAPSVFGNHNKAATTLKPKDSNVPVTISSRQFTDKAEDEEKTTEPNYNEKRRVRDTHEDTTTKNSPKIGNFDSKTITTTDKTPNYNNVNRNHLASIHPVSVADDREARATHKDDENVSPTLVPSQRNPAVYAPNFERNVPLLVKNDETDKKDDKPIIDNAKDLHNQKRDARDTHDEAIENTPKVLADGLIKDGLANKNAENVTKDDERKARSAQNGPKITPIRDMLEVSSTTASIFTNKNVNDKESENDADKHSMNPTVLTRAQNYPAPYPYETTPKAASTTKSPQKRDTESSGHKTDDKTSLNPKLAGNQNSTKHEEKSRIVSLQ